MITGCAFNSEVGVCIYSYVFINFGWMKILRSWSRLRFWKFNALSSIFSLSGFIRLLLDSKKLAWSYLASCTDYIKNPT